MLPYPRSWPSHTGLNCEIKGKKNQAFENLPISYGLSASRAINFFNFIILFKHFMFYYYLAFTQTERIFFFESWFFFVITPDGWGFLFPFSTLYPVSGLGSVRAWASFREEKLL